MYYLKKEAFERTIEKIVKTDGTVIPERKVMEPAKAIFKHKRFNRYYRQPFNRTEANFTTDPELKLYTCKKLSTILSLRKMTFEYCGEWFDVYDENGIVHGDWENTENAEKTDG